MKEMHLENSMRYIYPELRGDVDSIFSPASDDNQSFYPDPVTLTQSQRRNAVRAVYAFVEAMSHQLRLLIARNYSELLCVDEVLLLQGRQIEIGDNGVARKKNLKVGLEPLLKFTINIYLKLFKDAVIINGHDSGFKAITKSITVRDRLTHPKNRTDILVSDEEIRNILIGYIWMNRLMHDFLLITVLDLEERNLQARNNQKN